VTSSIIIEETRSNKDHVINDQLVQLSTDSGQLWTTMQQKIQQGQIHTVERVFMVKSISRGKKVYFKDKHMIPGSPSKKRERTIDPLDNGLLQTHALSGIPSPKQPHIGKVR
jgi:hypothetical protein